jgi:hypothetical protein
VGVASPLDIRELLSLVSVGVAWTLLLISMHKSGGVASTLFLGLKIMGVAWTPHLISMHKSMGGASTLFPLLKFMGVVSTLYFDGRRGFNSSPN